MECLLESFLSKITEALFRKFDEQWPKQHQDPGPLRGAFTVGAAYYSEPAPGNFSRSLGIRAVPERLLLDRNGVIKLHVVNVHDCDSRRRCAA